MKVLMLSANTGEGHNSSAKALMEVLEQKGVVCDLVDALAYLSPGFSKFICDMHVSIYKYGGKMFDRGYRFMENTANPDNFNAVYEILGLGAGKLRDTIMEGGYDAVVCVHPFAGAMATEARRSWGLELPFFLVATDYTCCPTVEQCDLDTFFIPAPEISQEFTRMGIPPENHFVSGIPVRQCFYEPARREEARELLHIPQDALAVLVMCGSMGCGPIEQITQHTLQQMPDNAVMIAVCGRNEKLRENMTQIGDHRLRVVGFTDQIPTYLDAVDMIITKPGGLSSTEAANKHVPMVFINAVGGCEDRNFNYFVSKGFAVGSADPAEVSRIAIRMVWDTQGRKKMRQALTESFSQNSALRMAEKIISDTAQYDNALEDGQ